jgi:predicted HTH transcriptional regulator
VQQFLYQMASMSLSVLPRFHACDGIRGPLIDVRRFLDLPPHSRNEALAALMRRMGVCEERGSGIDKVLFEIELYQLPPPDFAAVGRNTRVVLYTPRELSKMRKEDRGRAWPAAARAT